MNVFLSSMFLKVSPSPNTNIPSNISNNYLETIQASCRGGSRQDILAIESVLCVIGTPLLPSLLSQCSLPSRSSAHVLEFPLASSPHRRGNRYSGTRRLGGGGSSSSRGGGVCCRSRSRGGGGDSNNFTTNTINAIEGSGTCRTRSTRSGRGPHIIMNCNSAWWSGRGGIASVTYEKQHSPLSSSLSPVPCSLASFVSPLPVINSMINRGLGNSLKGGSILLTDSISSEQPEESSLEYMV